jgi:hypothetical protein
MPQEGVGKITPFLTEVRLRPPRQKIVRRWDPPREFQRQDQGFSPHTATEEGADPEFAELRGLTYSEAEEQLLTNALDAEEPLRRLPETVTALYFGGECDPALWAHWRDRTEGPHTSWFAYWRFDRGLAAAEATTIGLSGA